MRVFLIHGSPVRAKLTYDVGDKVYNGRNVLACWWNGDHSEKNSNLSIEKVKNIPMCSEHIGMFLTFLLEGFYWFHLRCYEHQLEAVCSVAFSVV